MEDSELKKANERSSQLMFKLDYRVIVVLLLAVIGGMLAMWRPWENSQAKNRTVEVTGQATLRAVPDEFVFYPSYEFKDADKQKALNALNDKSAELVAKLKALGVADSKIKTNSNGYGVPVPEPTDASNEFNYNLTLTVTVGTKELAQKVQDYLVSTVPSGEVSPQAGFSEVKRKALERQARDAATKDAKAKADQSAKNLGFKVAGVKTVVDGIGFDGVIRPLSADSKANTSGGANMSLAVQPGENDLSYSVTVTYFIK